MAGLGVVQRRELLHSSPAGSFHNTLTETAVQVAHELGVRLGELAEWAVQELDARPALVLAVGGLQRRLEPEPAELRLERAEAAPRARTPTGIGTPHSPGVGGVVGIAADPFRGRGEQTGEEHVRSKPSAGAPSARK